MSNILPIPITSPLYQAPAKPYVHEAYPSYRWTPDGKAHYIERASDDQPLSADWLDSPPATSPDSGDFVGDPVAARAALNAQRSTAPKAAAAAEKPKRTYTRKPKAEAVTTE